MKQGEDLGEDRVAHLKYQSVKSQSQKSSPSSKTYSLATSTSVFCETAWRSLRLNKQTKIELVHKGTNHAQQKLGGGMILSASMRQIVSISCVQSWKQSSTRLQRLVSWATSGNQLSWMTRCQLLGLRLTARQAPSRKPSLELCPALTLIALSQVKQSMVTTGSRTDKKHWNANSTFLTSSHKISGTKD